MEAPPEDTGKPDDCEQHDQEHAAKVHAATTVLERTVTKSMPRSSSQFALYLNRFPLHLTVPCSIPMPTTRRTGRPSGDSQRIPRARWGYVRDPVRTWSDMRAATPEAIRVGGDSTLLAHLSQ